MLENLPAAITSLSAAGTVARALIGIRDEKLLNEKVIELQNHIIDAQSKVLLGQTEQLAVARKIQGLETEITRLKEWSSEREKYELVQVGQGTFAFVAKDFTGSLEDAAKLCASCFEKRVKTILQRSSDRTGSRDVVLRCANRCPDLNFLYFLSRAQESKS